jgi:hypothetical protein
VFSFSAYNPRRIPNKKLQTPHLSLLPLRLSASAVQIAFHPSVFSVPPW